MQLPENNRFKLDPIIPFQLFFKPDILDRQLEDMVKLKNETGIRRFAITYPGLGVRINGFPREDIFENFAMELLKIKQRLEPEGIAIGWWCCPTLKSGKNPFKAGDAQFNEFEFQKITGLDGKESNVSACPLDADFRKKFSRNIQIVAERAKPFVIFFEDDFELSNHPGVPFGCFCPLHMAEFNRRANSNLSREQLMEIFSESNDESMRLRRIFAEVGKDSLVLLASEVRAAVDQVAPETRLALCQPGCSDFDGNMTEPVTAAFAGANTVPMVRCCGASYSSDLADDFPGIIFHLMHSFKSLPEHFECVHETDTYPHTRFYTSAAKIKSFLTAALLCGAKGSLLYMSQYLDDPFEETGYKEMIKACSGWFDTLLSISGKCDIAGVQVLYDPAQHIVKPWRPGTRPATAKAWSNGIGMLGIPCTVQDAPCKMLDGNVTQLLGNEQLTEILSGAVFLDGKAAFILSQRGFGDLIGVEASINPEVTCLYEAITENRFAESLEGRLMYNFAIAPAGKEGGTFYELQALDKTEVISNFTTAGLDILSPAMTVFENKLGGRVAVTAFDLENNSSASIMNYRKKELMRNIIEWLTGSPLPAFVESAPKTFCCVLNDKAGEFTLVAIFNLSSDQNNKLELTLPIECAEKNCIQLNNDGNWKSAEIIARKNRTPQKVTLTIDCECPVFLPVIFKFQ